MAAARTPRSCTMFATTGVSYPTTWSNRYAFRSRFPARARKAPISCRGDSGSRTSTRRPASSSQSSVSLRSRNGMGYRHSAGIFSTGATTLTDQGWPTHCPRPNRGQSRSG